MADRYNAPQLLNYYCLHECPIGARQSLSDKVLTVDEDTEDPECGDYEYDDPEFSEEDE